MSLIQKPEKAKKQIYVHIYFIHQQPKQLTCHFQGHTQNDPLEQPSQ